MLDRDPQELREMLDAMLQPWHDAVADPAAAQEQVLKTLLESYAQTDYGREHGAGSGGHHRRLPPRLPGRHLRGLQAAHPAGDGRRDGLLLTEEPVGWAITRGTTKGESKFIPMTPTDLMHAHQRRAGHDELRPDQRPLRPVRRAST